MGSANIDPAAILNRALEYAAQNLRVEKLLIQLGLDPTNISYDVVFNRLVDITLANINFANTLALIGAVLYVATLMVRTIVPLRILGILSIVFFIGSVIQNTSWMFSASWRNFASLSPKLRAASFSSSSTLSSARRFFSASTSIWPAFCS